VKVSFKNCELGPTQPSGKGKDGRSPSSKSTVRKERKNFLGGQTPKRTRDTGKRKQHNRMPRDARNSSRYVREVKREKGPGGVQRKRGGRVKEFLRRLTERNCRKCCGKVVNHGNGGARASTGGGR